MGHTWFYLLHHRHQCIRNLLRSRERVRIAGRWTDMYLFWVYMSCHVCFLGIHVTYLLWVYASSHVSLLGIHVVSRMFSGYTCHVSFVGLRVISCIFSAYTCHVTRVFSGYTCRLHVAILSLTSFFKKKKDTKTIKKKKVHPVTKECSF